MLSMKGNRRRSSSLQVFGGGPVCSSSSHESHEPELRAEVERHRGCVDALEIYLAKVTDAFEALACAIEMLDSSNDFSEIVGVTPTTEALLLGVREARSLIASLIGDKQDSNTNESNVVVRDGAKALLAHHREGIAACAEKLRQTDVAIAEKLRYAEKVEAGPMCNAVSLPGGAAARLARDREKLEQAERQATLAQSRAEDSLRQCIPRRKSLRELWDRVIGTTVQALRCTVASSPSSPSRSQSTPVLHRQRTAMLVRKRTELLEEECREMENRSTQKPVLYEAHLITHNVAAGVSTVSHGSYSKSSPAPTGNYIPSSNHSVCTVFSEHSSPCSVATSVPAYRAPSSCSVRTDVPRPPPPPPPPCGVPTSCATNVPLSSSCWVPQSSCSVQTDVPRDAVVIPDRRHKAQAPGPYASME